MASYSPVFSSQFILFTESTPNDSFLVPAGFTAVIRDFTLYDEAGGTIGQVTIQNETPGVAVVVANLTAIGAPDASQWTGRVVVPGGGLIGLVLTSIGFSPQAYVGGYLLRNTLT